MIIKKHIASDGRLVVSVCDESLLGKVINEGRLQLDLSGKFYSGTPGTITDLKECLPRAASFNFVGEESVAAGKKMGLISRIKKVGGVPFALVAVDTQS